MTDRPPTSALFRLGTVTLVVAAAVFAASCSSETSPTPIPADPIPAAAQADVPQTGAAPPTATSAALKIGDPAPDITLPAVDGSRVALVQLLQGHDAAVIVFYRGFF